MQVVMYIMAKPKEKSLRERIATDLKAKDRGYELNVISSQKKGRQGGWSKINLPGYAGALNLEWDGAAKTLIARAVTKSGNKPDALLGTFLAYLIGVHGSRIISMSLRTIK